MQNSPQWAVAFYAILRAGGVVVPVNPMNKADEFGHYITDPQARFAITSSDLAATVHAADERLPAAQRLQGLLVTRLAEAMPDTLLAEEAPAEAILAWLRDDTALPPGATAWADALAAGHQPTAVDGRPGRPGGAALHLGHHRPAQGLRAHAPHADGQRRGRAVEPRRPRDRQPGRGADVPHHRPGLQRAGQRLRRRHRGAAAALGPRTGRAPDRAPPRVALDLHPDHDRRPAGQPEPGAVRPLQPAQPVGRRCGDAAGRGRAPARPFRPHVRRRLWPHRNGRTLARQPARARQAAMPGRADLRCRQPHRRPRDAAGVAQRRDRRDRHRRADAVPGLLGPPRGDEGRVHRDRRASASSAPATWAGATTRATSSSPTA